MGGSGSTRWRGHRKRRLVEESLVIDLVKARRSGLLDVDAGRIDARWTLDGRSVATGTYTVGPALDGRRPLQVDILPAGTDQPISVRIELVAFRPHFGGRRWFALCPKCEKRFLKLYLPPGSVEVACRLCHGLIHGSAQRHDARLDLARRDPKGFAVSRARLRSLRSGVVTAKLTGAALDAVLAPRPGRGWGRRSMTSYRRAVDAVSARIEPASTH